LIYHITFRGEWEKALAAGKYKTISLSDEGFIHCSPSEKIIESAEKFFRGKTNLILLSIDENKVIPEIVYEDLYGNNFLFPHIYGELNTDSVVNVSELAINEKDEFILPAELIK
jgi:uncharacterized protein (DUF952 family)